VLAAAAARAGSTEAGHVIGLQWLVAISLLLGLASLAIQIRWMPHHPPSPAAPGTRAVLAQFPPTLRRLLLAEVFTRWCDWLVREFVVLYLLGTRGVDVATVGLLFALQNVTALITYLPIGRLTAAVGLQPFIGLTFVFFALFPLSLAVVPDGWGLAVAFVVYGLREIGEPARKALITSLVPRDVRAQGVGLYWGIRSVAVCWASLVGALVWIWLGPVALLVLAFGLGAVGAAVYYALAREPRTTTAGAPAADDGLTRPSHLS